MNMKNLKRILDYFKKYTLHFIGIFVFALLSSGGTLMAPYVLGKAIDEIRGFNDVSFEFLRDKLTILLIIYIIVSISNWLLTYISNYVSIKTVGDMRDDVFNKLLSLPVNYFDNSQSGNIMSIFSNDIEAISEGIFQTITQLFTAIITLFGSAILMIKINIWIAISVVIVAPLAVFVASFISKRINPLFTRQQMYIGEYNGAIEENISMLKVAKGFNFEEGLLENSSSINNRLNHFGQKAVFYSSIINPTTRFINNIAYISVGLIGGFSAINMGLTIGSISSLISYSAQFAKPLNEIAAISTQLQSALAGAERVFDILDAESEIDDSDYKVLDNINGNVTFENVDFSYSPDISLIEDFNINIPIGSKVAIVGPTGAGKTTIVNLLMRFYEIDNGNILIDGKNIRKYTRDSIRLSFGMVLQDTWLFSGTIKENLKYGKENATDEEIINATKAAKADHFITRLQNGYDTQIGENGGMLSQGEKQLLTIARAMISDSPMLILDEATSNIDPMTELAIQDGLNKLMEDKTSFVIAHRLSTIQDADIILVLDKGQILESGKHEELLEKKGFYYNLFNSQFAHS